MNIADTVTQDQLIQEVNAIFTKRIKTVLPKLVTIVMVCEHCGLTTREPKQHTFDSVCPRCGEEMSVGWRD